MATTLSELRSRIRRLLGDIEGTGYTDELLIDAIGAAHDAILPWCPKTSTTTFTGDGSAKSFDLPADAYEVESVIVQSSGEILLPGNLIPGRYRGEGYSGTNDWLEYPSGHLTFSLALDSGEVYDLYYLAHWTKPTIDTDEQTALEPPDFTMVGLALYSAAYALLPSSLQLGEIRQFATKVDSGTPEHNPMQRNASYLFNLFLTEMNRHPKYQKAQR